MLSSCELRVRTEGAFPRLLSFVIMASFKALSLDVRCWCALVMAGRSGWVGGVCRLMPSISFWNLAAIKEVEARQMENHGYRSYTK